MQNVGFVLLNEKLSVATRTIMFIKNSLFVLWGRLRMTADNEVIAYIHISGY